MPFIYHGSREACILHMLIMLMQFEPMTEHEHTITMRCTDKEKDKWVLKDVFHFDK